MWDVIIWIDDDTVDFVPSVWANEDCTQYKYPAGMADSRIRRMIYDCVSLDDYKYKWSSTKLVKRKIKNLQRAKELCSKAEETSNIEDEDDSDDSEQDEGYRKRRKPLRFYDIEENPRAKRQKTFEDCSQSHSEEKNEAIQRVQFKIPSVPFTNTSRKSVKDAGTKSSETEQSPPSISPSNSFSFGSTSTLTLSDNNSRISPAIPSPDVNGIELLKSIQFELKDLSRKIDRLENRLLVNEDQLSRTSDVDKGDFGRMNTLINLLPAKTDEEFMNLNKNIKSDNSMRQKLINVLYLLGGENPRKSIFLMMNKIFGKTLATEYSGQGKKKKKSFADTVLYEIVIMATRKRHPTATDEDIKKNISLFLASSKQRLPKESLEESDSS